MLMATTAGTVKKVELREFERIRVGGKIAIGLRDDDRLVGVALTDGSQSVMLFSSGGKVVCFDESEVRIMGREAGGVRGMNLPDGQRVISLIIASEGTVLTVTENGYGKRTELADFPRHHRGGSGVIAMQTSERNGAVVGATLVTDSDEIMLITDAGTLVRTRISEISVLGRNTQGVRVIRPSENEKVVGLDRIEQLAGEEDDDGAETGEGEAAE